MNLDEYKNIVQKMKLFISEQQDTLAIKDQEIKQLNSQYQSATKYLHAKQSELAQSVTRQAKLSQAIRQAGCQEKIESAYKDAIDLMTPE